MKCCPADAHAEWVKQNQLRERAESDEWKAKYYGVREQAGEIREAHDRHKAALFTIMENRYALDGETLGGIAKEALSK